MSIEIKFRAWDKTDNKMIYPDEKSNHDTMWTVNAWCDSENELAIIEQFTGLHDKNGKEIYEGDIVRISQCEGDDVTNSEVKFSQGGFIVEADFGDYDQTTIGWAIEQLQGDYDNIEVIGNIHQNPDLL